MDVTEKVNLVSRPPTEEVVTQEELLELFKTNSKPKQYIGIEISGFLHLGSLITTGFKINDFVKAGVDCTVFLADWHTLLNEKLGGNFETTLGNVRNYNKIKSESYPNSNIITRISGVQVNEMQNMDQMIDLWKPYADLVAFTNYTPWESSYENPINEVLSPCTELWRRLRHKKAESLCPKTAPGLLPARTLRKLRVTERPLPFFPKCPKPSKTRS